MKDSGRDRPGIDWTGERYVPWVDDPTLHYEHLHRYRFACEFARGRTVLDLACGEGFGAAMLAEVASTVVAIDNDPATIAHARARYRQDGLHFAVGSILDLPLAEPRFDVIVCYEAIEHIDGHDVLLSEIARMLAPDGLLLISTPNRALYSDAEQYENPYHVRELYQHELEGLLSREFAHTELFGQLVVPGSYIFASGVEPAATDISLIDRKGDGFDFRPRNASTMRYFVALASRVELPDLTQSLLIDLSRAALEQLLAAEKRAAETQREARDYQRKLQSEIRESRDYQDKLERTVDELEASYREVERAAAERFDALKQAEKHAAKVADENEKVTAELKKVTGAYRTLEKAYRSLAKEADKRRE